MYDISGSSLPGSTTLDLGLGSTVRYLFFTHEPHTSTSSGKLSGTSQNSLCSDIGFPTAFLSSALVSTFLVLSRNSSLLHSCVGVTGWGGLSGAGVRSMVKLALEPRRSSRPLAARRSGSGLRSGVARAATCGEYIERVRRLPSRRGERAFANRAAAALLLLPLQLGTRLLAVIVMLDEVEVDDTEVEVDVSDAAVDWWELILVVVVVVVIGGASTTRSIQAVEACGTGSATHRVSVWTLTFSNCKK